MSQDKTSITIIQTLTKQASMKKEKLRMTISPVHNPSCKPRQPDIFLICNDSGPYRSAKLASNSVFLEWSSCDHKSTDTMDCAEEALNPKSKKIKNK